MSLLSGLKFSKKAVATASPRDSTAHAAESATQQNPQGMMINTTQGAGGGLTKATGGLRGTFVPDDSGYRDGEPLLSKRRAFGLDRNTSMKRRSDVKRMAIGRDMSDKQIVSRFKRSVQDSIQTGGLIGLNKDDIGVNEQQFSASYEVEQKNSTSESECKDGMLNGASKSNVMDGIECHSKLTSMTDPTSAPPTSESGVVTTTAAVSSPPEVVGSSYSELNANANAARALRARLSGRKHSQPMQLKETKEDSEDGQVQVVTPHVADIRLCAVGGYSKRCPENETDNTTAFLRKEIVMGPQDMDEVFTRNLLKMGSRYKGSKGSDGLQDEDAEIDTRMYEDRSFKLTELESTRRRVQQAKREHAKSEATEKSCPLCMSSGSKYRHDIVASMGQRTMLLVEIKHALVKGHCIIAPIMHSESLVSCDEDVLWEVQAYKSCLMLMAEKHGKSMVFMETAPRRILGGHAHLECVPIPAEVAHRVPLFFRQALSDAGEEWSTHKLIKLGSGGIRKAVPSKGFAYFSVEWSACEGCRRGGYAHIIEDQRQWSRSFGRDTIGAILKRDRLNNSIAQSFQEFQEMWAPFDDTNFHHKPINSMPS